MGMQLNVSAQAMMQQWRAELSTLERQIQAASDCVAMLQEAQRTLRQDGEGNQTNVEKALDLMIGSQLSQSLLGLQLMREREATVKEAIKQADSPISRPVAARGIRP